MQVPGNVLQLFFMYYDCKISNNYDLVKLLSRVIKPIQIGIGNSNRSTMIFKLNKI